ncbi:response regulator receiver protein [Solidesulfovibrio carbinoliphilus subsp. oakridgensis]|uniref:Response regulator receiver protein n=1 Tax=Solidesulfovibrio carbinoliphilus subsp. oakridgensis TaxID=694327 RepID=G7Q6G0_9BACT|nr:response regulator [Solidesulfovibrio carbinoliphilus]EHJ47573.1 response regulator receiver protein [Solidesulfovibrio carbinoliphilus subsp. oakridgensis]
MCSAAKPAVILLADDDEDDVILIRDSFKKSKLSNDLRVVEDGVELVDYLRRRGAFADPALSPRPDIILLDLNMPRMDGREALREIKNDPNLKDIPVIVLTTSQTHADIYRSYKDGANCFITKPVTFQSMCEIVSKLGEYWFQIVKLPED